MKRIFITGAPSSGTTLLRRLFFAFDDVEVIDGQIYLKPFCEWRANKKNLVGKRNAKTIFSHILTKKEIERDINLILKNQVKIINIVRDGRDVVVGSHGFTVAPDRWIECVRQAFTYGGWIALRIKYEDLVTNPDKTQNRIAKVLKLKPLFKFSEYPNFVPKKYHTIGKGRTSTRPIDTNSLQKDLTKYRSMCKNKAEIRAFDSMLRRLKYI